MNAYAPIAMVHQASRAYGLANLGQSNTIDNDPAGSAAGISGGFSSMVSDAAESAMNTMRHSERLTAQGVAGKADVQDVVEAASNAEVTVKTTVAILGKAMNAYNDVLKMAV
jgi:flagellar hook-basal body complex protein FliE